MPRYKSWGWGRRDRTYSFFNSALDWPGGGSGQRHAPVALYPRGKDARYPRIGDCVDPTAGLDARSKIIWSAGNRTPVVQSVVRHYPTCCAASTHEYSVLSETMHRN